MDGTATEKQTGSRGALEGVRVGEAMHRGVFSCAREAPLTVVARLMSAEHVHCVVVEGGDGIAGTPVWGVVSDLDLVAAAAVRELGEQTAEGSAATPVVMISPEETLDRAARSMAEHGAAHLIVVDPATLQPVGIISTLDVAAALALTHVD